jgi:hypothetical protein
MIGIGMSYVAIAMIALFLYLMTELMWQFGGAGVLFVLFAVRFNLKVVSSYECQNDISICTVPITFLR